MLDKNLEGVVYISAYSEELKNKFDFEIKQLQSCGWDIAFDDREADISVIDSSHIDIFVSKQDSPSAYIVICEDEAAAKKFDAIAPDAFSMLSVLGGGGLERALVESIDTDATIDEVVIGLNWSMIIAGRYCGVARSPSRGTEGARTIRPPEGFRGKSLKSIARLLLSCDELSRSLGLAAVNAFWNLPQDDYSVSQKKSWGFAGLEAPGDGVVVIGDFGANMKQRLPMVKVIEREPKLGQVAAENASDIINNTKKLIITGQTLANGSLELILRSSNAVDMRMLLGPSVPMAPVMFEYGLNQLGATAIHDVDAAKNFVSETGSMIMLDEIVQKINMSS